MELQHHGIKGQKWGVRRYQNPDGSLTAAGRKKYSNSIKINDDTYLLNKKSINKFNDNKTDTYDIIYKNKKAGVILTEDQRKEKNLYIDYVLVKKKFRGNKLATQSLNKIIEQYNNTPIKSVSLDAIKTSEDAIHIYKKLGFKTLKNNDEYELISMKKQL